MRYDAATGTVIYRSKMHAALNRSVQVMPGAEWLEPLRKRISDRLQSAHFDLTGIAIGRAQVQYILGAMPGSAESAPNRRHRPETQKEQN